MEYPPSKFPTTRRTSQSQPRCINPISPRVRFPPMLPWKAPQLNGDRHVLVYLEAGGGSNPALYEMWQGIYEDGPWTDSSNALWPNVSTNNLTAQGNGTSDAAGLPVGPLLANADEVIGTGTPSSPNGTIQHPIRFTLNHMLNYWVWPATKTAGVGSCTASGGGSIPTESEISQATPPGSCTMSGAAGEIYRLKASIPLRLVPAPVPKRPSSSPRSETMESSWPTMETAAV